MPLFSETESKIFGDVMFDIVSNTNLTRASPGSKTRAIAQAVSKKMGRMWSQFDLNIVQAFLTEAEGEYLDFIGAMLGIARLGEEPAGITADQRVGRFYVEVGTFGQINSGLSIYIPAGHIVSTGAAGTGIRYRLPYAVILPSDASEAFVPLEALRAGAGSNVGPGQLVFHDFLNYADSLAGSLKVTNQAGIINGHDIESDTNFRFRIANQTVASERANQTAVRLAALTTAGVADVVLLPFHRGIGSYELLIKATSPSVPLGLIDAVEEACQKVTAQGIVLNVRGPDELGISMLARVTLRRVLSPTEETNVLNAATQNVVDYINNLDISEELIVNEIVERVMGTSDLIKNIGQANKPIERLWLHRPSLLEANKVRSTLLGDFAPESDEKLLVEDRYAGSTPIRVQVAR
jgi:uncharacterized phage protein gp47/JayE